LIAGVEIDGRARPRGHIQKKHVQGRDNGPIIGDGSTDNYHSKNDHMNEMRMI